MKSTFDEYRGMFRGYALEQFDEMTRQFPFDATNNYVIAIEYDGCEMTDFIGIAPTYSLAIKVLKIAYKRNKNRKNHQPCLMQNCRMISFSI